jgi:hypothetical protein
MAAEYLRSLQAKESRAEGVALSLIEPQLRLSPQRCAMLPRALPLMEIRRPGVLVPPHLKAAKSRRALDELRDRCPRGPRQAQQKQRNKPTKVTGNPPDRIRMCGTRRYALTNCAAKHTYRESYAVVVRRRMSSSVAQHKADRTCPSHVHSSAWMYAYEPVSSKRFYVTCLSQTTA